MEISKVDLTKLRNDDHFQFVTETKDLLGAETAVAAAIKPLSDNFSARWEREDEALKKIHKSALTEQIREADKARDETFSGTAELVRAMCKHFNPTIKEMAKRLQVVMDTYGNVAAKTLTAETSAIYNLLQELDLPKYTDDRINCNLNPWLNELKNRNEAFETLYKKRNDESAAKSDVVLKEARTESDNAYAAVEKRINALIEVEGAAKYENFVRRLNAVIAKYTVKKPHHRLHGEPDTDEETGEEE